MKFEGFHNGGFKLTAQKKSSEVTCFSAIKYSVLQKNLRVFKINLLTPNDPYMGRTAPLTSKHCILYIYSTNIGTEYFKHAITVRLTFLTQSICMKPNFQALLWVEFSGFVNGEL